MSEIYWLTRVDAIYNFGIMISFISGLFLVISMLGKTMIMDDFNIKSWIKILLPIFIFGLSIILFVPSRKDLYLIYGIGTMIEYARQNDKMQEIPDKAIDALIKYLEGEEKKE